MLNYKQKIITFLNKELKESFKEDILEIPPEKNLGDYAFPCFILSKKLKKSPLALAKDLEKLKIPNYLEKIEASGPYLNFFLSKSLFVKEVMDKVTKEKEKYGSTLSGNNKKIMIEFSQPNTHKPFHVGHLRNVCIGDYLSKLYTFNNYKVLTANYIGDIGMHVAKSLWALEKFHKKEKQPLNKGKYLGKIYAEANEKLEKNPGLKEEVSQTLQKLENNDPKLISLWRSTRLWSIKEFKEIYSQLNVTFDLYFYESEVEKKGQKIVDDLINKKVAVKDQGAILVDLDKYNLGKFLIRKSDGTSLYSTKDLALVYEKFDNYKIDEAIYVVGSEQTLYFRQLLKTLELMGFKKIMKHVPYNLVMLNGKKISSRKGQVALYEDFYEEIMKKTIKDLKKRYTWKQQKTEKIAKQIVLGAIKFTMLNQDTNKEIDFNPEKALGFEGDTCPYIQYTATRINSILKKVKSETPNYTFLEKQVEFELVKKISRLQEVIKNSQEKNSPHILTNYLLDLCHSFNEFYHSCPIIDSKKGLKGARINLAKATKQIIENSFSLLNIPLPKEM